MRCNEAEKHLRVKVGMNEGVGPSNVVNVPALQGPGASLQQAAGSQS